MKIPLRMMPLAALVALALTGACNRDDAARGDTTAMGGVMPDAPAALSVVDIDMGRHIGPDKKITDGTDDFAPNDTIYASVHTSGTANNSPVMARWTFQDGSVVDEQTHNVTTTEDTYTEFHIAKPGGFPKGKYTVHIMIDGREVRTKDVTVE